MAFSARSAGCSAAAGEHAVAFSPEGSAAVGEQADAPSDRPSATGGGHAERSAITGVSAPA